MSAFLSEAQSGLLASSQCGTEGFGTGEGSDSLWCPFVPRGFILNRPFPRSANTSETCIYPSPGLLFEFP